MSAKRRTQFGPEAIRLFLELEGMRWSSPQFEEKSRALAEMLGLTDEWVTMNHVIDRTRRPCHPPEYISYRDWHTCRRVREQLLAAVGGGGSMRH